jgi:ketosteroid isomerase-like protein
MEDVVVTRVRCNGPPMRSRNLAERLEVRFPSLCRRLYALAQRRVLTPRSRLRRAILRRGNISGWAAFNRGDFELMLARYAPDVEFEFDPGEQTLGRSGTFRGHEAMARALAEQYFEGWGQFGLEPAYILDLGDRVLCLGFQHARGHASGVQLEQENAQLVTVREGLVTRDVHFFTWEEGLRAAGLDPDAIALPKRRQGGHAASIRSPQGAS